MEHNLVFYNTLSRKKETFKPLNPPYVGMYLCGPTVYGDAHLGHARPAIVFDVLFRYLTHLGYKVRFVRNITDVGHLVADADEGEDKIAKKAILEKLEPMEVVNKYTNSYHRDMDQLNVLRPSIEPRATGHILEQCEMIEKILEKGFAYESNGSVYFDVNKYHQHYHYGKLSGRKIEDLQANTRTLDGQDEKRNHLDFALWKKADSYHLMRWNSKWGEGFPGWHLECSAMSEKYLGKEFDIHAGGMDLQFPHHECEIAQSVAANGKDVVKYWLHNNMLTVNGQKMGKSLGNFITLEQLFSGQNEVLEQPYSPMTIRFFILQAHYRSPLDFSNEALQASEKGLQRLVSALKTLQKLKPVAQEKSKVEVPAMLKKWEEAINDDLNTPILLAHLFDAVKTINSIDAGALQIGTEDLALLQKMFHTYIFEILGLKEEQQEATENGLVDDVMNVLLDLRKQAKKDQNFALADSIREQLEKKGITIKDTREGTEWSKE